jgi:glycerol uptake facilitator-like aquaporin
MRNSAYEAVLTTVLLFGVATVVRWVIGTSPISAAIPGIHLELLLVGVVVGLLLAGLIASPLGKVSGGHLNPAISLAMWRFGTFPGWAVLPYVAAQLAGSLLGVLLARAAWGSSLAEPSVAYGALRPAPGWSNTMVFLVEGASMAVIIMLVGVFLSVPRLTPRVPWLVGGLIGAAIAGLGTVTGGCVNPARQFGPAIFAGQFGFLGTYLLAPLAGAVVAPWLLSRCQHRKVLTHRLGGDRSADGGHDAHDDRRDRLAGVRRAPGHLRGRRARQETADVCRPARREHRGRSGTVASFACQARARLPPASESGNLRLLGGINAQRLRHRHHPHQGRGSAAP